MASTSQPSEQTTRASGTVSDVAIRDAATVILVRDPAENPRVLMGQRGSGAAFMPNKFVFPGGAVDQDDGRVALAEHIPRPCASHLELARRPASTATPTMLAAAAIRELWEEAGLILGKPGTWRGQVPPDWASFAATGHVPAAGALRFVFRAITPAGRPRRFDARFFLADAAAIATELDDFGAATDELAHLQWIRLDDARGFDLPFITEVVLAEVAARLPDMSPPENVPFFDNSDEDSLFAQLGGRSPLR